MDINPPWSRLTRSSYSGPSPGLGQAALFEAAGTLQSVTGGARLQTQADDLDWSHVSWHGCRSGVRSAARALYARRQRHAERLLAL